MCRISQRHAHGPATTLYHPNPQQLDHFGYSVAIAGTRGAVGADEGNSFYPVVPLGYVFDLASATPTVPLATLAQSQSGAVRWFRIFRGRYSGPRRRRGPYDDAGADNAGATYVYDMGRATPRSRC